LLSGHHANQIALMMQSVMPRMSMIAV